MNIEISQKIIKYPYENLIGLSFSNFLSDLTETLSFYTDLENNTIFHNNFRFAGNLSASLSGRPWLKVPSLQLSSGVFSGARRGGGGWH